MKKKHKVRPNLAFGFKKIKKLYNIINNPTIYIIKTELPFGTIWKFKY